MVKFQPRKSKTPSKATLAKLSTATYIYGKDLSSRHTVAPDGGAITDYPKGWRFLPPATKEEHEILKKNPKVVYAMERLHNLGGVGGDASGTALQHKQTIERAHYDLVIAPQIKAQKEAIARKEEEERQAIATLKMRVQELTKKPIDKPTPPPETSSFPIIPIIIIAVIVGFFLLRRRA
tara:strand:- start:84 stop:620 length:537 start_codon:yes stop_codon:yes gene_type:complete